MILKKNFITILRTVLIISMAAALFSGCKEVTSLMQQLDVKEPNASVQEVKLTALSLQKADIL